MVGLVLKWIETEGGLEAVEARNKRKAAILYNALDELTPFYGPTVTNKADRSLMNVTWRLRDEALEPELLAEAKKAGMDGLKGHRSVGGFRASIYNAFPEKGVQALADLLQRFCGAERVGQKKAGAIAPARIASPARTARQSPPLWRGYQAGSEFAGGKPFNAPPVPPENDWPHRP